MPNYLKKKVLILAYDFPPYNSIGAQRPYSWYKYLKEFNWEPIVVTRHWDEDIQNPIDYIKPSRKQNIDIEKTDLGTIIRVPFKPNLRDKLLLKFGFDRFNILRKLLTLIFQAFEFIIPAFDNRRNIYKSANNYIKSNKVDTIIATGEPFILFKYAAKLSQKHKIPWLADYRDGWSTNYNRSKYEKSLYRLIEKRLINSCSNIITVSDEFKEQLSKLHPKKLTEVVMNGYFHEPFKYLELSHSKVFTIGFAGTLYSYQPIELFAEAFKFFVKNKNDIRINFIGVDYYQEQKQRILQAFNGYHSFITTTNRLPHLNAIEMLNQSHLLLLPASPSHAQLFAKVFDYLALNKMIILFRDDKGALSKIIKNTNSGFTCNTTDEIINALEKTYTEWQQTGHVKCDSNNIQEYSRIVQTKKISVLLNKI